MNPLFFLLPLGLLFFGRRSGATSTQAAPVTTTTTKLDTDPGHLHPDMRPVVDRILTDLRTAGWSPRIIETWRRSDTQAANVDKGVSWVAWSFHQYAPDGEPAALAVDIIDSRYGYTGSNADTFFDALEETANAYGYHTGNGWRHRDAAHVQALPSNVTPSDVRDGRVDPGPYLRAALARLDGDVA